MITDFEKYLYNLHLKITRQQNNKPYNIRKNFSDLSDKDYASLKKLSNFFNKHKEISPESFFSASYKIHKDEKYFELSYFNTLKAIKAYTIYNKDLSNLDPDSEEQLAFTKKSLVFIYNFCKTHNIVMANYLNHKTNDMFSFLLHIKNRDINLYSVLSFNNLNSLLSKSNVEVLRFMFEEEFLDKVNSKKIKFLNSKKCKHLVITGLDRLENILKNELNISKAHIS